MYSFFSNFLPCAYFRILETFLQLSSIHDYHYGMCLVSIVSGDFASLPAKLHSGRRNVDDVTLLPAKIAYKPISATLQKYLRHP